MAKKDTHARGEGQRALIKLYRMHLGGVVIKAQNKATVLNSRRLTEFLSWGSHSGNAKIAFNVMFVRK